MNIVLFCHSIVSDWNHGSAHFLRGVVTELQRRGHRVRCYEPRGAWSFTNLVTECGQWPVAAFHAAYPTIEVTRYGAELELDAALDGAELVIVHEWSEPGLVAAVGRCRASGRGFRLLFLDTHHRSVSDPDGMSQLDLAFYDGALVCGDAVRELYRANGWAERVWTWHVAADTNVFKPLDAEGAKRDLVWVGNWSDEERGKELRELLLDPARQLMLRADVYGARYPEAARAALARSFVDYRGWLPNYRVPEVFAAHHVTVHIPRRPYLESLPGVPGIRVFEALACGIPLVTAPWQDSEGLFREGVDYLVARDGEEMRKHLRDIICDPALGESLAAHGLETIQVRHTCAHRVDELTSIVASLDAASPPGPLLSRACQSETSA